MNGKARSARRQWFVERIYATHNSSTAIRAAVNRCLGLLKDGDIGLNVGAGATRLHPALINLDIAPGPVIDCCADAEQLPFPDDHFALVVCQETIEHVRRPSRAIREMHRTLRPGGTLYLQAPFIIGYHPGPTDFWRFSREGLRALVEDAGFACQEVAIAVGPGTGCYRIMVEFLALLLALGLPCGYRLFKGFFALTCFPLKWLDPLLRKSRQADRIAGGYYVIATKTSACAGKPLSVGGDRRSATGSGTQS